MSDLRSHVASKGHYDAVHELGRPLGERRARQGVCAAAAAASDGGQSRVDGMDDAGDALDRFHRDKRSASDAGLGHDRE